MYASRNGVIIPKEEAVLPITSREVQSGFYVYESLRVLGGFVTRINDHLDRLLASAKGIHLTHPFTKESIHRWVDELIEAEHIGDATVRITLYGGADPVLFIVPVELLRYPDSYYRDGVKAVTFEGERLFPTHKSGSLLLNYVALEEAKRFGGFEALLVDRNGRVLEGTRSNFFAFSNNTLHTADEDLVLGGITRSEVLRCAKELGFTIDLNPIYLEDLLTGRYTEAFISATSMAAMPLHTIDDLRFSAPFERTRALHDCVRARQWQ